MNVDKINFVKNPQSKVKAYVHIKTSEGLVLQDFRIVHGSNGYFVGWPNKQAVINGEKSYPKTIKPINDEVRENVDKLILQQFYAESEAHGVNRAQPPKQNNWMSNGYQQTTKLMNATASQPANPSEQPDTSEDDSWDNW